MQVRLAFKSNILLSFVLGLCLPSTVFAQMPGNRLGDATVTPGSSSKFEPYGLNSSYESASATFSTRHTRAGNEGGIGSSFLGTTSATAESKSASTYIPPEQLNSPAVPSQNDFRPRTFSENMMYSPALSSPSFAGPYVHSNTSSYYGPVQNIESFPVTELWGHQKSWGSFQTSTDTSRGFDLFLK